MGTERSAQSGYHVLDHPERLENEKLRGTEYKRFQVTSIREISLRQRLQTGSRRNAHLQRRDSLNAADCAEVRITERRDYKMRLSSQAAQLHPLTGYYLN